MTKKLRDLLHDAKEVDIFPPPAPAHTSGYSAVDEDMVEQENMSHKEFMSAASSLAGKNSSSVDEATAADPLVEIQPNVTSSTEFIVIETLRTTEESKEKDDSLSLEDVKSSVAWTKESSESSQNGEILKPEKAKKTVRLQGHENNVTENVILPKALPLKPCPSVGTNLEAFDLALRSIVGNHQENGESTGAAMMEEALERLKKSYVYFKGKPVGTFAAMDPNAEALNYNQVSVTCPLNFRFCRSDFL